MFNKKKKGLSEEQAISKIIVETINRWTHSNIDYEILTESDETFLIHLIITKMNWFNVVEMLIGEGFSHNGLLSDNLHFECARNAQRHLEIYYEQESPNRYMCRVWRLGFKPK